MTWQWKVLEVPKGGDERHKKTGDSAAGVYVIFSGRVTPNRIKYVWSASLPVDTTTESPFNRETKIVVLRNQTSPMAIWLSEKVNVYEDHKGLFGREPSLVQAIGIMSDSDNTQSAAMAHYKKIQVSWMILVVVLCPLCWIHLVIKEQHINFQSLQPEQEEILEC